MAQKLSQLQIMALLTRASDTSSASPYLHRWFGSSNDNNNKRSSNDDPSPASASGNDDTSSKVFPAAAPYNGDMESPSSNTATNGVAAHHGASEATGNDLEPAVE